MTNESVSRNSDIENIFPVGSRNTSRILLATPTCGCGYRDNQSEYRKSLKLACVRIFPERHPRSWEVTSTCFHGNKKKNNCEVWRLKSSPFLKYKGNRETRKWLVKFRDFRETGPWGVNPYMTPTLGIEPESHCLEACAISSPQTILPKLCSPPVNSPASDERANSFHFTCFSVDLLHQEGRLVTNQFKYIPEDKR